ncbi:MAG: prolyl-tRNA synthetase associated domain-containing protein [Alphaproteobacteria bacterium]
MTEAAPDSGPDPRLAAARQRLWDRLEALGIATRTVDHPPVFTVAESQAMRGSLPGGHCKSLFLRDKKGRQFLVVALEDRPVDLKALRGALGAGNLSFASAERLMATLGVAPGSVTPFGLINADPHSGLVVALDRGMLDHDPLNYHPLSNDATTAIAPGDLVRFVRACGFEPLAVDLAADPPRPVPLPAPD